MDKKDYANQIRKWLECRREGLGIKESFIKQFSEEDVLRDTFLCYVQWLILPGEEKKADMTRNAAREWNEILFAVFANQKEYQRKEEVLWERLAVLEKQILEESEKSVQEIRLMSRSMPEEEKEIIGRERELEETAQKLKDHGVVFLYGIGGIGKSAVARAYAKRYALKYDTIVYASCERGLRELFVDDQQIFVKNMAYAPKGKRGEMGWYTRRKLKILAEITDEKTLLIIDNYDVWKDPLLKEALCLPCHLLFTTRVHSSGSQKPEIEIRALERKKDLLHLFALYYGTMSKEEEDSVWPLLQKCRGHTLYIKLLAKAYAAKNRNLPYSNKFEKPFGYPLMPYGNNIETVFRILDLPKKEKQMLKNASLLPVAGMEQERFLKLCGNETGNILEILKRRGLLEYDAGRKWISLHPVLCLEIRKFYHPAWSGCRTYVRNFAQEVSDFWNMPLPKKMEYQAYIPAILEALPLLEKEYMDTIFSLTDLLWQLGQWSYARQRTKMLYEKCQKVFGCPHPYTAHAAHLTASVFHNLREKEKAALWFGRTWEAYRDCTDKTPREEALYRMKYNRYLVWQGKYEEAKKFLISAEEIYLKEIAAERDVFAMSCSLQNTYIEHTRVCISEAQYKEALFWNRKAKEIAEKLNESAATRIYIFHDEAVILEHMGETVRAEECFRQAEEWTKEYVPDTNPERLEIEKWRKTKEKGI